MPKRPLNQCLECGHTWYPRGTDLSRKCPACGVVFGGEGGSVARAAPRGMIVSAVGAIGVFGFVAIGFCVVLCAGAAALLVRKPEAAQQDRPDPAPDKPVGAPGAGAPEARGELAPAPRRRANEPPDGFASEWVRRGATETRVVGATVARPTLADLKGGEYLAPDPVLLVWVQTRRLSGGPTEVRRWVGALNSDAKLVGATGVLDPVRFPGAVLAGQLERAVTVSPGGPGATDVLAFRVPGAAAQTLTLVLAATHVGESGEFVHGIPAEVWKK